MTQETIQDSLETHDLAPSTAEQRDFAKQLRQLTIACAIHHEKMGIRKALTKEQTSKAAQPFSANGKSLQVKKLLIDTNNGAYKLVTNIRFKASAFWRSMTVPFPDPGVRLIRKNAITDFVAGMESFRSELQEAVENLQAVWSVLRNKAKEDLGELFLASDYPTQIAQEFSLSWDFPNIEPPAYLKDLHPQIYEQECQRIKARFEEAAHLTEQAFAEHLHKLISHLADRLSGDVDGKPKTFKNSSIENLTKFFDDFKKLDFGCNPDLQNYVDQAQKLVAGISAEDLRSNATERTRIGTEMGKIQGQIESLMIEKPKRAMIVDEEESQAEQTDTTGADNG